MTSQAALEETRGTVPQTAAGGLLLWVRRLWKQSCQSMQLAEMELHPPHGLSACCSCGQKIKLHSEQQTVTCYTRDDGICKATVTVGHCSNTICGAAYYASFW
jgi:hypothetical protein